MSATSSRERLRLIAGPGLDRIGVDHRRAGVAERLVDRVRRARERRRLLRRRRRRALVPRCACRSSAAAAHPLVELRAGRSPAPAPTAERRGAARARQPRSALGAQRQAVVGDRAGGRRRRLDDVEPVHLGLVALRTRRPFAKSRGVAHAARPGAEEVGVERHDDTSAWSKSVRGLDRPRRTRARAPARRCRVDRLVLVPLRLRAAPRAAPATGAPSVGE